MAGPCTSNVNQDFFEERIFHLAVGGVEDAFFMEYEITVEVATQPDMMPRSGAGLGERGLRERPGARELQRRNRFAALREIADRRTAYTNTATEQRALDIPEEDGC